jgi:hypothetical protein
MTEILLTITRLSVLVFLVPSISGIGLGLTLRQVVAPLRNSRLVIFAVVANFIIAPALAVELLLLPLLASLSAAPRVDLQSAHAFAALADELAAAGTRFQAVEPRSSVRDHLRSEGVENKLGGVNRFTTVADAVESFQP